MIEYQKPKVEKITNNPITDSKETHPCYAQIRANRISGGKYLYGSDFNHQYFITITISESELNRSLSLDWPFERKRLLEVSLSEAQWATFVSNLHSGNGTQCTLEYAESKNIPQLSTPAKKQEQFKAEGFESVKRSLSELQTLKELIESLSISNKNKDKLLTQVDFSARSISSNLNFIAKQFGEHLENNIEKAKIEVEAYIQNTITEKGLNVLQNKTPLLIENKE